MPLMKTVRFLALVFLAAGITAAAAQTYTFTTLAGDAGYRSTDGPGSAARFQSPGSVAVDGSGNVFVADSGNSTIRKISADGVVTTLAGVAGMSGLVDGTGSSARFGWPRGVAVDGSGNVFVADAHTIRKITATGEVTMLAGTARVPGSADGTGSDARFNYPEGVAVDGSGNVFVADSSNHTIRKITAGGVVTTLAGTPGSSGNNDGTRNAAKFNYPQGVAVDGSGNVFVADRSNNTIRKIASSGVVTTLAGSANNSGSADGMGSAARFNRPQDVAVDSSGNVFVSDQGNFTIRKITPVGGVTTVAGSAGRSGSADGTGSAARFGHSDGNGSSSGAGGVAVDGSGNVFVADTPHNTIRKITVGGVVTTLAGSASNSADGMGSAARFNYPGGVAVDGSGNVFVADTGNYTIRKITADGDVTTLAGSAGSNGSANGTGSAARFGSSRYGGPYGVAADNSGNVFVADTGNHTIRKITADGVVTTLAGTAGSIGSADGTGSVARFYSPHGVAVDGSGNVFVADTGNFTIRKITAGGVVTTLAGSPGRYGSADGTGSDARFGYFFGDDLGGGGAFGVAVDSSGNVFVADFYNSAIRKITAAGVVTTLADVSGGGNSAGSPVGVAVDGSGNVLVTDSSNSAILKIAADGVVTTVAGLADRSGSADGPGSAARFLYPGGVAVDGRGNVFVADTGNGTIRKAFAVTPPQSQHINTGMAATFTVVATETGFSYQWKKDGKAISGATGPTYGIASTVSGDMGFYSVVMTSAARTLESTAAILTVATDEMSRLSNFSARAYVPAGGDFTVGFAIRSAAEKSVLLRAIGPTLGSFGVTGALADPKLDVLPAGASVGTAASNDDWGGGATLANAFASVGAFPLAFASKDAAVARTLAMGGYTARVTSSLVGRAGTALAEVYDRDPAGAAGRFGNISTLGFVGADVQAPALGFVIDGAAPKRLLIRAVGPGLTQFGVSGRLDDPQISVIPIGEDFVVASNDNWNGDAALASAFASAGSFPLPATSKDAALVVRLPPGGYTVTVSGVGAAAGRALVEIYDLDP